MSYDIFSKCGLICRAPHSPPHINIMHCRTDALITVALCDKIIALCDKIIALCDKTIALMLCRTATAKTTAGAKWLQDYCRTNALSH